MSSAAEHFDKILEELTLQCLFGQVHYRIWRQMNNKFKEEPRFAETAIFFFRRTAEAHLNSATLYLNHLIDKDRRATSIYYLINYAQKHPDIFKHSSEEQVVEAIEKDREHLDQFDDLLKKIRQQRDKHFMHRAKEYLPHPKNQIYKDYPTTYLDIYTVLENIGEMLTRYRRFMHGCIRAMTFVGEEDFEHLLLYLDMGLKYNELVQNE